MSPLIIYYISSPEKVTMEAIPDFKNTYVFFDTPLCTCFSAAKNSALPRPLVDLSVRIQSNQNEILKDQRTKKVYL